MNKKVLFFLTMVLLLPAVTSDASTTNLDISSWLPAREADSSSTGYQAYVSNGHQHYRSSSPFKSLDIKHDGDIRVSNDDRSIKSISPGGYLKISIRTFGNNRELLINSSSSGSLSYEFREGRNDIPYEPEGRKWLEDILLDVVRSSGIDADGRTRRYYSRGGLDAVFTEMGYINSSSVKSMYFTALIEGGELSNKELSEIAYAISGKISSNTTSGRLYRKYSDAFLADTEVAIAYFSAISKITSSTEKGRIYRDIEKQLDFSNSRLTEAYFSGVNRISSSTEQGSVLRHTILNQELTIPAQAKLLVSASKISSNTESGRVIRALGPLDFTNPQIWESYFAAVDHLSSSTEAGSVLRDAIKKNKIQGPAMISMLSSARKISSDTEVSSVMRSVREIELDDAAVRDAYFNVIRMTSSTTESGRMLRYTLENHSLNKLSMINLYETTKRISSSTEMSSVLRASVPYLDNNPAVLDAFFACTNVISSSTEQGRVLRRLTEKEDLDRYGVSGILLSAQKISSNTEAGSVIRAVAPRVKQGDKALKDLYMETAKTLSSDSEFRRTVDAIM